jgi:hypothetical protein
MGHQIDPKKVVGRNELIQNIWKKLQKPPSQASLRFTAERRIGKTTVLAKLHAEPVEPFDVLFLEVEGIDSCDALVELILNRAKSLLSTAQSTLNWFNSLLRNLGGTEIGGVIKLPISATPLRWQQMLEKAIEELCKNRPNRIVLLLFDELPYMLQKIDHVSQSKSHPQQALTLLDTLRALRQRCTNLRMIFAGSVGLHHVLRDLRKTTLASEPVNDMPYVEIGPLKKHDAIQLALQLIATEQISCADDPEPIAQRIAFLSDCIPFYMERIVSTLALLQYPIQLPDIDRVFLEHLTDDNSPLEMEHFRERLPIYYRHPIPDASGKPIPSHLIARAILDFLALNDTPQTVEQVHCFLASQFPLADRSAAVDLLQLLARDHYLTADLQKRYTFRFSLVKRWWKLAQGLPS